MREKFGFFKTSVVFYTVAILPILFSVNSALGQDAPTPTKHVFNLEYMPNGFGLDVSVDLWKQDMRFEKEPDFGQRHIVRGLLLTGTEEKYHIGFAWDKTEGKLYIDLNRNRDLTDDPNGIFESVTPDMRYTYTCFEDIHLPIQFDSTHLEFVIQMSIYDFGYGRPHCQVQVLSGFQAEIELYGKKWLLKVADNMDGKIMRSDRIVLIPVEANMSLGYEQLSSSIPETVFFDGRNYNISFEFQPGETAPLLQVNFLETESPMGELLLEGKFIKRLVLEVGTSLVLLDSPETNVSIPAGNYHWRNIFLDGGEAGLFKVNRYARKADEISVSEGQSATLKIGGPLHNSVEVQRMGNVLTLKYKLVGVDGCSYESLRGRGDSAPTFAVYKKGNEIFSGKFEYG